MSKILIDTNVCLDAAQKRMPFAIDAAKILALSESGKIAGYLSAHSFDTIFYLLKKRNTIKESYKGIRGLRKAVQISPVTQEIIDKAINSNWTDFEDAIHHESALAAGCEAIVTRNEKGFSGSKIPVFSPRNFLDQLS